MTARTDQPVNTNLPDRTTGEHAEVGALRRLIAEFLAESPVDEHALRRTVWSYVGVERYGGTPAGHVIVVLIELIEAANIKPATARQALTRRMILWGVEAYFGHFDGDVVGRDGDALSDSPDSVLRVSEARLVSGRPKVVVAALELAADAIEVRHSMARSPRATPAQVGSEPEPFPSTTAERPETSWQRDWRERLTRNLSRRSDGRWEPLTWTHAATPVTSARRPTGVSTDTGNSDGRSDPQARPLSSTTLPTNSKFA